MPWRLGPYPYLAPPGADVKRLVATGGRGPGAAQGADVLATTASGLVGLTAEGGNTATCGIELIVGADTNGDTI